MHYINMYNIKYVTERTYSMTSLIGHMYISSGPFLCAIISESISYWHKHTFFETENKPK